MLMNHVPSAAASSSSSGTMNGAVSGGTGLPFCGSR